MRFAIISLVLSSVLAVPAAADPADKNVGIGLGVGIATGPNLQLVTSMHTHVDVGLGYQLDDRLRVQSDFAWRLVSLASASWIDVPLYLGVGGFVSDHRFGPTDSGLRMPLGVQADFARAPIEVFGEVAPELTLFQVADTNMAVAPPDALAVTGLMGVRAAF